MVTYAMPRNDGRDMARIVSGNSNLNHEANSAGRCMKEKRKLRDAEDRARDKCLCIIEKHLMDVFFVKDDYQKTMRLSKKSYSLVQLRKVLNAIVPGCDLDMLRTALDRYSNLGIKSFARFLLEMGIE